MSHWEGFGTLLMATDTSNALLDPVLYGAYTVCRPIPTYFTLHVDAFMIGCVYIPNILYIE